MGEGEIAFDRFLRRYFSAKGVWGVFRGRWRGVLAVVVLLFLAGGFWVSSLFLPEVQVIETNLEGTWSKVRFRWSSLIREVILWLEFLGSISLSLIVLSWATGLLFGFLGALVYCFPRLAHFSASMYPTNERLARIRDLVPRVLRKHDRLVGTVLNLSSSLCALFVLSWIVPRPLDYWDFGIQFAIALIVELIVLGAIFKKTGFGSEAA